jgi:hypothetical protein
MSQEIEKVKPLEKIFNHEEFIEIAIEMLSKIPRNTNYNYLWDNNFIKIIGSLKKFRDADKIEYYPYLEIANELEDQGYIHMGYSSPWIYLSIENN